MRFERGPGGRVCERWRNPVVILPAVVLAMVAAAGCSGDSEITVPAVEPVTLSATTLPGADTGAVTTNGTEPTRENVPSTAPVSVTAASLIPGLDSTVEFCAAWSRFTGSYTLVAPAWAVSLDPDVGVTVDPAVVEVVASPTMVKAYFDLGTNWPTEIAEYQEEGMTSYRPLLDRMNRSLTRLKEAGATQAQLTELDSWWEGELANFNGDSFPALDAVPPELQAIVAAAADKTRADEVPMVEDRALVSDGVNAVYDYLAVTCPDRGQLAGEDVAATVGPTGP